MTLIIEERFETRLSDAQRKLLADLINKLGDLLVAKGFEVFPQSVNGDVKFIHAESGIFIALHGGVVTIEKHTKQ